MEKEDIFLCGIFWASFVLGSLITAGIERIGLIAIVAVPASIIILKVVKRMTA